MKSSQKKKSNNTKKTGETESSFQCSFCDRVFQREQTVYTHLCDYKRRWQERGQTANRIGYNAWVSFYKKSNLKKNISYMDFAKSRYYTAFVKFGHYCSDIKAINTSRYVDWLFDNNIKLHEWCSDVNYNKFLIQYLKDEDPFDAVSRSVETMIDHAKEIEIQGKDCFRYANKNRIVQMIVNGKISPWILYNCELSLIHI